jgi:8-oxo-dGTP pyrophosphatase MutT (NUDIX family)
MNTDKAKREEMMVECEAFLGGTKLVPQEKLSFRPAAYGIIVNDGKVLLVTNRNTGQYYLPGGGCEIGEKLEDVVRREVYEETGIEISVGSLVLFRESFFYYDPQDVAFHGFSFFFRCTPRTLTLIADEQVNDIEAEKPRWIEIKALRAADFQTAGEEILALLKQDAV